MTGAVKTAGYREVLGQAVLAARLIASAAMEAIRAIVDLRPVPAGVEAIKEVRIASAPAALITVLTVRVIALGVMARADAVPAAMVRADVVRDAVPTILKAAVKTDALEKKAANLCVKAAAVI